MTTEPSVRGRKSLEELLGALDEAEGSEEAFLQLILDGAARRDPELPDVLRAGAIPRTLNAEIVGVLRGLPDETERNRELLERVSEYRFVLPRPDGGLTYHDNTRDALLADWSTERKQARFRELNEALAAFYEARYAESRRLADCLYDVSELIGRTNPGRLRRLTAVVGAELTAGLLEAAYHRLTADPQDGFDFFKSSFFALESANRVDVCRSLISFTRDFLERLPAEARQPTLLAWLEYFEARVQLRQPGYDTAGVELVLRRLLEREDLPADLLTWTLDDLAVVYETRLEIDDALRTRRELIEQRLGVDPYNDPLRHSNLANLYWWLGDYASATPQFELALQKADKLPGARGDMGVLARLDLSGMQGELGDWDSAFGAAIEALYRARRSFQYDAPMQQTVAGRLAQLLSTFDTRASDCAAAEAIALAGSTGERLALLVGQIDVLLQAGRIRTARAWIDRLAAGLDEGEGESWLRLDLAYRRAKLAELEDREADANEVYSTLLDEIAGRPGSDVLRLNALMNRGANRATLGDVAGAVADLTAVRDEWACRGCPDDAARTDVLLAEALLKADEIQEARTRLDAAEAGLSPGVSQNRMSLLTIEGDLRRQLEEWPAAAESYGQALDIATARRDVQREASLLRKLAAVHADQAQTELSAEYERRADLADRQRADADAFNPTGTERLTESENGKGMRSFCEADDRATALGRARQFFASTADLDADNLWPLLNLSFVYAEEEDWQAAGAALERVFELCPAPMRTARLSTSFRDYMLEHARSLLRRNDASRATAVSGTALERLAGELPAADLVPVQVAHCVALAIAVDPAAARDSCRAALAVAAVDGQDSFVQGMAGLIDAVETFWPVDAMLQELKDEPRGPPAASDVAAKTRDELGRRLDEILGLSRDASAGEVPIVVPVVVEIGDSLVPIVDSRQDGGAFLYELIPAMRDRIRATTGVTVPGVRMRGNPGLPMQGYCAQVDEVPVLTDSVDMDASLAVLPFQAAAPPPAGELTDFHPLTGEPGLWVLAPRGDGRDGAGDLTSVQYLVHRIELVIRAQLARYLGPEEVAALVNAWAEEDEELVSSVVPDADARLRLTWLLQGLVAEGVPLTDSHALLTTIREAGGIAAPTVALRRAVRGRLRHLLPGLQGGRAKVFVPAEHEEALLRPHAAGARAYEKHDVLRWLRRTLATSGPAITLVTRTQEGRELVSALARSEDRVIATLSQDELAPA